MVRNLLFESKGLLIAFLMLFSFGFTYAQVDISGTIRDSNTNEPMVGVSVSVKGLVIGTISNVNGEFSLSTNTAPPFVLVFSSVGYQTQELTITGSRSDINISLEEQSIMGQEIVVSASRIAESEMKSPVTIEKVDLRTIRETASTNFYDAMGNMKGINLTTQGLLFKSVNMRGFGAMGNPRIVQLIDGMDNMSPALNFAVDNIVGMPELDVESVEILPGAASALYGANAINGIILMNSKSPFLYQGVSANIKTGIMHDSGRTTPTTPFYDASVRYAKAFNDKLAFKVNLAYLTAKDWQGRTFTNLNVGGVEDGTRGPGVNPDYDGMTVYGDEVNANIRTVASQMAGAGLIPEAAVGMVPDQVVSRTGFREADMVDPNTSSFKTNLALHYRLNEKVELIGQYNFGNGTTLYSGNGRYSLKDFNISQYKLEMRGDNFELRGYRTTENSGKSATLGLSSVQLLNATKPHATWFGEYVGGYLGALQAGADPATAHATGRSTADVGIPTGDVLKSKAQEFNELPIIHGGGGFLDKSSMDHIEGMYNFKNYVTFMDLLVGGNYRHTTLNSNGTLFNDRAEGRDGTIGINEFGAYIQGAKSMFNDHFRLTASVRYDKHQNFDAQISPRVSGIFSFGQSNIRLSYQTGFRNPTNQNQYINLRTAGGTLIGGLPELDVVPVLDPATNTISRYIDLSKGISKAVLDEFSAKGLNYFDAAGQQTILGQAQTHGTSLITAQVTQQVTAAVNANRPLIEAGVRQVVEQNVTQLVATGVDAMIAAGQLPAAHREIAIAQGVADQMQSAEVLNTISQNVDAQVTSLINNGVQENLPGALQANLPGVVQQLAPAYGVAALPKYKNTGLKPERISSYEIGYKGLLANRLFVDAYYYYSVYKDFIGGTTIVVPTAPSPAVPGLPIESGIGAGLYDGFSRTTNTKEKVEVTGWAAALNYSFNQGFNLGANVSHNRLTGFTPSAEQLYAGFNSPEYTYNVSFGKRIGSGDLFGFNLNLRHQTEFKWEGGFQSPSNSVGVTFFSNTIVPAITNFDAQVSIKLSPIKSILKIGGNNIGGKPYFQAFGAATVGSTYYVSLTFDELFQR